MIDWNGIGDDGCLRRVGTRNISRSRLEQTYTLATGDNGGRAGQWMQMPAALSGEAGRLVQIGGAPEDRGSCCRTAPRSRSCSAHSVARCLCDAERASSVAEHGGGVELKAPAEPRAGALGAVGSGFWRGGWLRAGRRRWRSIESASSAVRVRTVTAALCRSSARASDWGLQLGLGAVEGAPPVGEIGYVALLPSHF